MANKRYVFSDPHFFTPEIATERGFKSVTEHDEYIVQAWNKVVTENDEVYLLGDLGEGTISEMEEILYNLNGSIHLVIGNHDKSLQVKMLADCFTSISSSVTLYVEGMYVLLTHIPVHPSMLFHRKINVHGHTHFDNIYDTRYANMSADVTEFKPFPLDKDWISTFAEKFMVHVLYSDDTTMVYNEGLNLTSLYDFLLAHNIRLSDSELKSCFNKLMREERVTMDNGIILSLQERMINK